MLFIGAPAGLRLPDGFASEPDCIQGFRPAVLDLQRRGFAVQPSLQHDGYDLALVLCGRHRGENEMRLAQAILAVRPDAPIIVAGATTDGIGAMRKRLAEGDDALGLAIARKRPGRSIAVEISDGSASAPRLFDPLSKKVSLDGSLSKHHGQAFWLRRGAQAEVWAGTVQDRFQAWPLVDGRFRTAPGMFSFDRIDAGSRLLAETLPTDLKGKIADVCAGWGYLAAEVAQRCPRVTGIDLYEADHASLEAARANLSGLSLPVGLHWHDLVSEPVAARYDAIVMNPPFHAGRAADPALGQSIIAKAAAALKSGGRLFLVANRQLPYEKTLQTLFSRQDKLADTGGFKVIVAAR